MPLGSLVSLCLSASSASLASPVTHVDAPIARKLLRLVAAALRVRALALMLPFALPLTGVAGVVGQSTFQMPGVADVGGAPTAQPVTMAVEQAGVSGSVTVVTQGNVAGDYTDAGGGSCAMNTNYALGDVCTVNVQFKPKYPGQRNGAVRLLAQDGSVLATTFLVGSARGPVGVIVPGVINTVAGNGAWIYRSDNVLATNASIFLPMSEVVDAAGNLYLADSSNNRVRKVDATTGLISTVAGNGSPGIAGDGGPATSAMISNPAGLALDGAGNLYIADSGNSAIRRIDAITGVITTVAGTLGQQGSTGDGGPATAARLSFPYGIAFDAARNLYIADTGNNLVRRVDASTGIITTIAGSGVVGYDGDAKQATAAALNSPWNVVVAADGSFYIADLTNNRIRRVDTASVISTVAGTAQRGFSGDGGPATSALLNNPASMVLDVAGNLFIADSGNNRVRKVNVGTGVITTISGNDSQSMSGDAGPADAASLYGPYSLFIDGPGNLYIGDMFHNRIREINSQAVSLEYATIRVSKTSPPQSRTFENDGNAPMNLLAPLLDQAALDPATTTCAAGSMAVGISCTLGVEFAPTVVGDTVQGAVTLKSDAGNSPNVIHLSGKVLTVEPTTAVLSASANPAVFGIPVTLTATVSSADTSRSGNVDFMEGNTLLGSANLDGSGVTSITTSSLSLGQHTLIANYAGDANNASSSTPAYILTVKQATTLVLGSSANPETVTNNVTFSVTASAASGVPTGSIVFSDGGTALGSGTINASGVASFAIATLSPGQHNITASYAGDATDAASQSNGLTQTIAQAATTTTLGASSATTTVGLSVTFNATVTSNGGPTPTGSVVFMEGSVTLGSVALNSSGAATLAISNLTPGTHSITAAYAGDANSVASTSAMFTETVQQIGTMTAITSDANPADAGGTLQLTGTVSMVSGAQASGTITGLVTFQEGSTIFGSAAVNASGVASISIATPAVGTHAITAVYAGNTNYATSSSAALSEQVRQTSTTTSIATSGANAIAGKALTITASVLTVGRSATGTVTFKDGTDVIGQGTLDAQGKAVLQTTSLAVGPHSLTATYNGDTNYQTSASAALPQTIKIATTVVTMTASASSIEAGTALVLSVNLSGDGGQPTGSIEIRDGGALIATLNAAAPAPLTFSTSSLSVATHGLTANYTGDAKDASSSSSTVSVVVQLAATSVTAVSSQTTTLLHGSVTFSANVGSSTRNFTGSVVFADGSATLGTVAIDANGSAVFTTSDLPAGQHAITAFYSGDTIHATGRSAVLNQLVVQPAAVAVTPSVNPAIAGLNIGFTARVIGQGSQIPAGRVTFKDGATTLGIVSLDGSGAATFQTSSLAVGQHGISASYEGDLNYQAATSPSVAEAITNAQTQVQLSSNQNPATAGTPLILRAVVTGNGGTVTGPVSFMEGSALIGRANVDGSGVATFVTSSISPGNHTITASYAGDANNAAASSAVLQQSVQQVTTTSLASSLNPALRLDAIVLTASVSNGGPQRPTGTVTFSDGATVLGTVTLDASGVAAIQAPAFAAGNHNLIASYRGDVENFASASNALVQAVQLRSTTSALTASATSLSGTNQETLISVVRSSGPIAPTGTVTFLTGSGAVAGMTAIDSTGVATLTVVLDSGPMKFSSVYSGDSVYARSSSSVVTVSSGVTTQFQMDMSPNNVTVASKQHSTINVTLTSVQGFADTLSMGCLGLPFAATCTFSADQPQLKSNGAMTVHMVIDTGSPLGAGAQATAHPEAGPFSKGTTPMLAMLPVGALLGLWGLRRKKLLLARALLMLLLMTGVVAGMSGCGSIDIKGTPAGTYLLKVTASGVNTGITLAKDVTLTVTQ